MPRPRILLALDWYDYRIHRGVARVAAQLGWDLVNNHSHGSRPILPESWEGDGVIALIGTQAQTDTLVSFKCPIVDIGLLNHGLKIPRLVVDNDAIGQIRMQYFLECGFASVLVELVHYSMEMFYERFQGLRRTME